MNSFFTEFLAAASVAGNAFIQVPQNPYLTNPKTAMWVGIGAVFLQAFANAHAAAPAAAPAIAQTQTGANTPFPIYSFGPSSGNISPR
jgi:hypothetical protein